MRARERKVEIEYERERERRKRARERRREKVRERERDCFYYVIIQTYDVGLHSRGHPMEFDAGTRHFKII